MYGNSGDGLRTAIYLQWGTIGWDEKHFLDLAQPNGLPIARLELDSGGTATITDQPIFSPLGERAVAGGGFELRQRFMGQLALPETRVLDSSGAVLRDAIAVGGWRAYDPRVGQYLSPEPMRGSRDLAPQVAELLAGPSSYGAVDALIPLPSKFVPFVYSVEAEELPVGPQTLENINFDVLSPYAYAARRPYSLFDEDGLHPESWGVRGYRRFESRDYSVQNQCVEPEHWPDNCRHAKRVCIDECGGFLGRRGGRQRFIWCCRGCLERVGCPPKCG